jgi:succinate-acetate transporter protein
MTPGSVATVMGPSSAIEVPLVADPAPLGLAGFGLTTAVLSAINTGLIGGAAVPVVLALAIPFGGIAQGLAGMWAFRRGNTFAATAFTSYGAFWISFFFLELFAPQIRDTTALSQIVGVYLFAWGVFTTYMLVASLAGAKGVSLVFLLLAVTFFLLAIGAWANNPGTIWTKIGGYTGLATAAVALYVSFADVTNANFKRIVLPTTL